MICRQLQRLAPVRCLEHGIPAVGEGPSSDPADGRLVLDNQNGGAIAVAERRGQPPAEAPDYRSGAATAGR